MLSNERTEELMKKEINQSLKLCIDKSIAEGPQKGFEELIKVRDQVDKETYCLYVRILTQLDTYYVSMDTLKEAYKDLTFTDVMYEEEIEEWKSLPDIITIYRGTDPMEYPPRISWSLDEKKARFFNQGQMYKGIISKNDIMGFFNSNTNEKEIIAIVPEGKFDDIF